MWQNDKCVIHIYAPMCQLLGCQAYGLLFKGYHVDVGYYRGDGWSHGYTISLVMRWAIVKKICCGEDLSDESYVCMPKNYDSNSNVSSAGTMVNSKTTLKPTNMSVSCRVMWCNFWISTPYPCNRQLLNFLYRQWMYQNLFNVVCIIYLPSSCSGSKLLHWQSDKGHWWMYGESQKAMYCNRQLCPAPGGMSAPLPLSSYKSKGNMYSWKHTIWYIILFRASLHTLHK